MDARLADAAENQPTRVECFFKPAFRVDQSRPQLSGTAGRFIQLPFQHLLLVALQSN